MENEPPAPQESRVAIHSLEVDKDIRKSSYLACTTRKIADVLKSNSKTHWLLLSLSAIASLIGYTAGALLMRFYFVGGGSRKWLSTWLQTSGWPLLAILILLWNYTMGMRLSFPLRPGLIACCIVVGSVVAFDNFIYAWGISCLSASTNGLLNSSSLVFNAVFAMLIVRQRITIPGWNAVVLITSSAVLLALHADDDRPPGVTVSQYKVGYVMTIVAAALYGLLFPLTELVYTKFLSDRPKNAMLELQVVLSLVATIVATIAMVINKDFAAIQAESEAFTAGKRVYYHTLVWTAVAWQIGNLGTLNMIFLSSSLLAQVVVTSALPVSALLAVAFFGDNFGGFKIMAMLLCIWGFVSYIYGGYIEMKEGIRKDMAEEHVI